MCNVVHFIRRASTSRPTLCTFEQCRFGRKFTGRTTQTSVQRSTTGPRLLSVCFSAISILPTSLSLDHHLLHCSPLYQGKYNEADELYQRALAIDEKVLGPEHPDVATDLNNRAPGCCTSFTDHHQEFSWDFLMALTCMLNNSARLLSAEATSGWSRP